MEKLLKGRAVVTPLINVYVPQIMAMGLAGALLVPLNASSAETVPALRVVIDQLHPDVASCGIQEDDVRAAIVDGLRREGIAEDRGKEAPYPNPWLYTNLNVIMLDAGGCIFNARVAIQTVQPSPQRGHFRAANGEDVYLCQKSGVGSEKSISRMKGAVTEALGRLVGMCFADVKH